MTQEQLNRKYHTIFGVMKTGFWARNFLLIKIVFKFLNSVILVGVYESNLKQIGALFGLYALYFLILCGARPFKQKSYNIFVIIVEAIVLLIHFVFMLMVASDGLNGSVQLKFSLLISWLVILIMCVYLVFTTYYILVLIIEYIKYLLGYKSSIADSKGPVFVPDVQFGQISAEEQLILAKLRTQVYKEFYSTDFEELFHGEGIRNQSQAHEQPSDPKQIKKNQHESSPSKERIDVGAGEELDFDKLMQLN